LSADLTSVRGDHIARPGFLNVPCRLGSKPDDVSAGSSGAPGDLSIVFTMIGRSEQLFKRKLLITLRSQRWHALCSTMWGSLDGPTVRLS
jgi:hypothetical protein